MANLRTSIVASVLFTLLGGPCILLVLIPWLLTRFRIPPSPHGWHVWAGTALLALGLFPLFDSMVRFVVAGHGALVPAVPTERLVMSGLYRLLRNPMYAGVETAIAAEAILFWSRGVFIEFVIACAAFDIFVQIYEEPRLLRAFGDQYRAYRETVPRWFPRLRAPQ